MSIPYNLSNPNMGYIETFTDRKCKKESYKCPHAGCMANWSNDKKEFVCPCHGSRFSKDGKVLQGPADKDLDCN